MKTIADVSDYLGIPPSSLIKSLLYIASGRPLLVLVRGDDQLNEHLLRRALGSYDLRPANTEEIRRALGADPGSIGPVGVPLRILADHSLRSCRDMACGANKDDYHLTGVEPERDFRAEYVHLRQVRAGDPCPDCGKPLTVSRARLLLRSAALLAQSEELAPLRVLGPDNKPQSLLITAHRVSLHAFIFALVERFSDENGLVLPLAVCPFDVLITPIRYNDPPQKQVCDRVYELLGKRDLHVLIDDRDASPGVKFKDADLIGIPLRITIGPKKLSEGKVELRVRATGKTFDCPIEDVAQRAM
jgi:prolyl-tRNA synthetase